MGAKCCMPVRDETPMILRKKYRLPDELYDRRNNRWSPSWSFRCDNRTHIEDIMDNPSWHSHEHSDNVVSAGETEIEGLSDGSSPSEAFQPPRWRKFDMAKNTEAGTAGTSKVFNTMCEDEEIRESASSGSSSDPKSPSSADTNPSSSGSCSQPSNTVSSGKAHLFTGHQICRQISESRFPTLDSLSEEGICPVVLSFGSSGSSAGESHGASSSDGWSMRSFSELVVASHCNSKQVTHQPSTISSDLQTCRLCSKFLRERSSWKANEIAAAAVLVCGHVYHAECLEAVTPEASKFDPSCPVCAHGEGSAGKELMKAGSRMRSKISRRAVADIDVGDKFIPEFRRSGGCMLKDLRLGASSSGKSSFGRSFLRRHFSMGSRPMKLSPERECPKKKGFRGRHR